MRGRTLTPTAIPSVTSSILVKLTEPAPFYGERESERAGEVGLSGLPPSFPPSLPRATDHAADTDRNKFLSGAARSKRRKPWRGREQTAPEVLAPKKLGLRLGSSSQLLRNNSQCHFMKGEIRQPGRPRLRRRAGRVKEGTLIVVYGQERKSSMVGRMLVGSGTFSAGNRVGEEGSLRMQI